MRAQRATTIDLSYLREVFERFGLPGELERFRVPSRIRTDALQDLALAVHKIEQELINNPGLFFDVRAALCRETENIAQNARRREAREAARFQPIDRMPDAASAEDIAELRPIFRRLLEALDELPRVQRLTVLGVDLEGRSLKEVAAMTNASVPAAKNWLLRGRLKLRRLVEGRAAPKPRKARRGLVLPFTLANLSPLDKALLRALLNTEEQAPFSGGPSGDDGPRSAPLPVRPRNPNRALAAIGAFAAVLAVVCVPQDPSPREPVVSPAPVTVVGNAPIGGASLAPTPIQVAPAPVKCRPPAAAVERAIVVVQAKPSPARRPSTPAPDQSLAGVVILPDLPPIDPRAGL